MVTMVTKLVHYLHLRCYLPHYCVRFGSREVLEGKLDDHVYTDYSCGSFEPWYLLHCARPVFLVAIVTEKFANWVQLCVPHKGEIVEVLSKDDEKLED